MTNLKQQLLFIFAAMMLAYQPIRALATLNMGINQGITAARRILPIIDLKNNIKDSSDSNFLTVNKGEIKPQM